jgi:hypothetical protein
MSVPESRLERDAAEHLASKAAPDVVVVAARHYTAARRTRALSEAGYDGVVNARRRLGPGDREILPFGE